ncbi:MAG: hypothetical protein HQM08_04375 [Candidatus Riflebacteria bacterium]|nr:hypothetical protein [Candidatus Riflebacteria bacterium]
MEGQKNSGIRELQIANGLVTLRWIAIPMLLGFALISTRKLGMIFPIEPLYITSCILAILNIYFTIHISMLSRQVLLRHGQSVLRRFMVRSISSFINRLKSKGVMVFFQIPGISFKLISSIYLMVLEALGGLRFNLLSIKNVMHSQVIMDTLAIVFFIRFTGSTESPLTLLSVIPIIMAGAVLGWRTGAFYAIVASCGFLGLGLLVNFRFLTHIKFYGPQFGDLGISTGWTISNFMVLLFSLLGTAYISNHLTNNFKERIFFLTQFLDKSRKESSAQICVAENCSNSWVLVDPDGIVIKYKRGAINLFPQKLLGQSILEEMPVFKQYGLGYILQSVLSSRKNREIDRIRVQTKDGLTHNISCRVFPIIENNKQPNAIILIEDITEVLSLREKVESLRQNYDGIKQELEKNRTDTNDLNQQLAQSLKIGNERAQEIVSLNQKVKEFEESKNGDAGMITSLSAQLTCLKGAFDSRNAKLSYKQMILEEMTELLKSCTQLENLTSMIERRSKALFKLDNACLQIFPTPPNLIKMEEILDHRRASPRLLDLPRKNPKVLEPVLNEGQPVVIRAEVRPDNTASMAITKGNLQRLVAYIPIRHGTDLIGMMMLDRYGAEDNSEKMLEGLAYYLGHTAIALKNAIETRNLETKLQKLTDSIEKLEGHTKSLFKLINFVPSLNERPFSEFAENMASFIGANDVMIVRLHSDGTKQCLARYRNDIGYTLLPIEEPVVRSIVANPKNKAIVKGLENEILMAGFPLCQGPKLSGALIIHFKDRLETIPPLLETSVRLAEGHLSLLILREEKELWENFYQTNLKI